MSRYHDLPEVPESGEWFDSKAPLLPAVAKWLEKVAGETFPYDPDAYEVSLVARQADRLFFEVVEVTYVSLDTAGIEGIMETAEMLLAVYLEGRKEGSRVEADRIKGRLNQLVAQMVE